MDYIATIGLDVNRPDWPHSSALSCSMAKVGEQAQGSRPVLARWTWEERTMVSTEAAIVVECGNCGQRNRIPVARLREHAHCGQCKAPIHDPGQPVTIDCASLETLLAHAPGPVLVDFFTEGSQPARFLNAQLVRVARDMSDDVIVAEVDVDREIAIPPRYCVRSAPLLVLYRDGKEVWRSSGARTAVHLENELRTALGSRGGQSAPLQSA